SDIAFWDLALVHDELAAVGLAWDQNTPPSLSTADLAATGELSRPPVPIIRPEALDPAAVARARGLLQSGFAAYKQRRFAAASADVKEGGERFQVMRQIEPFDPWLARQHGVSLGLLASSLRDLKRPAEGLARARQSLAVYESLDDPNPG